MEQPTKKTKSYKREIAIALVVWFMYITETKDVEIIEILVWPVFTFLAMSFGLDWFTKSGGVLTNKPSEPSDRK